jgi:hypothetical protein
MVNGPKVTLAEVDKTPTLEIQQGVVGGLIEPIFTIDSPTSTGLITGYMNEEANFLDLPMAIVVRVGGFPVFIRGNVIFSGLTNKGATRSLTDSEITWLKRRIMFMEGENGQGVIVSIPREF